MTDWKTIDTAPKDGTFVDLWVGHWTIDKKTGVRAHNLRRVPMCSFRGDHKAWVAYGPDPDSASGWLVEQAGWFPSHWAPVPEPPTE